MEYLLPLSLPIAVNLHFAEIEMKDFIQFRGQWSVLTLTVTDKKEEQSSDKCEFWYKLVWNFQMKIIEEIIS